MKNGSKKWSFELLKTFLVAMFYFAMFCTCIILLGFENSYARSQPIVVQTVLYVVLILAMLIFVSMFIYKWDKLFPSDSSL